MELEVLPLRDRRFQMGLVVCMIKDYEFLRSIIDDLKPEHFDGGVGVVKLYRLVGILHNKYKRQMTIEMLRNHIKNLVVDGSMSEPQAAGLEELIDIGLSLTPSEMEYVKSETSAFISRQIVKLAVGESAQYLDRGNTSAVYTCIMDACKRASSIGAKSIGYDYANEEVMGRYSKSPREGMWSTGYSKLDNYLGGGMASNEAYTILSPTGRGKTSFLCNLSSNAQRAGVNTLFITLEMQQEQIAQRHDSILSGFSSMDIFQNKELQSYLQQQIKDLNSAFFIQHFNPGTLSINALKTYLDRFCNDVWKPQLLILDWLGCLQMPRGLTGEMKQYEQLAMLMEDFVNLTREYSVTGVTASQTNRSAAGNDTFDYGSIAGSFDSLFKVDAAFTLGASPASMAAGKRVLGIQKNRFGPDGVHFQLQGDLPGTPLTFKFVEAADASEEEALMRGN